MAKKNDSYAVYTRWLAVELRKAGYKIIGTTVNEYHPEFTVWLFENTDELREKIKELSATRKQNKSKEK